MSLWRPFLVVLASLCVVAPGALAQAPETCVEPGPCVYVTPDNELVREVGTTFTFFGRGWVPGRPVTAKWLEFCPPDVECDNPDDSKRIVPDARGRFTFTLRYDVPRDARPAGDTDSVVFLQQRRGRQFLRSAIPFALDATPAQRAEARAVARVVRRAHLELRRREARLYRAWRRADRDVRRCYPPTPDRDSLRYDVSIVLGFFVQDRAAADAAKGAVHGYARRLQALDLQDPVLRAAADDWIRILRTPRPWTAARACAAAQEWRKAGYPADRAPVPVDPSFNAQTIRGAIEESLAITAGGRRLRALGAGAAAGYRFGGRLDHPGPGSFFS